jgi:hypothetical protein
VQELIQRHFARDRLEFLDRDREEARREWNLAFREARQPNRLPLQELPQEMLDERVEVCFLKITDTCELLLE